MEGKPLPITGYQDFWNLSFHEGKLPKNVTEWSLASAVLLQLQMISPHEPDAGLLLPAFVYFLSKDIRNILLQQRADRAVRFMSTIVIARFN